MNIKERRRGISGEVGLEKGRGRREFCFSSLKKELFEEVFLIQIWRDGKGRKLGFRF